MIVVDIHWVLFQKLIQTYRPRFSWQYVQGSIDLVVLLKANDRFIAYGENTFISLRVWSWWTECIFLASLLHYYLAPGHLNGPC